MNYKLINPKSEFYQKMKELRETEKAIEAENKRLLIEKIGGDWTEFLGSSGQQNYFRVTQYKGFKFNDPEKVCKKTWRPDPRANFSDFFIPNKRTKQGKEIEQFILNGLKKSFFDEPFKLLGMRSPVGSFQFPYVELCADVILIWLGDRIEINLPDFIEITRAEWKEIFEKALKS